jgi:hypothetical protein
MEPKLIPNTLYVNYSKRGKAIADHEVEDALRKEARLCINGQRKQFNVSTENVVTAARAMKISGELTCNLMILFEGEDMGLQKDGGISEWPNGFCDYNEKWLCTIVSYKFEIPKK